MFANRVAAGRALAEALERDFGKEAGSDAEAPVVMALPRGGVPVALEVARALGAPLDVVLVRKVGLPWHPELAAAAVVDGDTPEVVRNERVIADASLSDEALQEGIDRELAEIERRRAQWCSGRARPDVEGRRVIVVDDGIATGSTALAALKALRRKDPSSLTLAVPVAPSDSLAMLKRAADRVICLDVPTPFYAVGQHYSDFRQIDDSEVAECLAEAQPFGR